MGYGQNYPPVSGEGTTARKRKDDELLGPPVSSGPTPPWAPNTGGVGTVPTTPAAPGPLPVAPAAPPYINPVMGGNVPGYTAPVGPYKRKNWYPG